MAPRDILVCIDVTAAGDGRLELALNLAQANKAHLTAVYALPEPRGSAVPPAGVGLPPTVLGPVSPEGARAMEGQPISADRAGRRYCARPSGPTPSSSASAKNYRCARSTANGTCVDHTDLAEMIQLAKRPIWRSSGNIR